MTIPRYLKKLYTPIAVARFWVKALAKSVVWTGSERPRHSPNREMLTINTGKDIGERMTNNMVARTFNDEVINKNVLGLLFS